MRDFLAVIGACSLTFSGSLVALAVVKEIRSRCRVRRAARSVVAGAEQLTKEMAP